MKYSTLLYMLHVVSQDHSKQEFSGLTAAEPPLEPTLCSPVPFLCSDSQCGSCTAGPVPIVLTNSMVNAWQVFEAYYRDALQAEHARLLQTAPEQQLHDVGGESELGIRPGMLVQLLGVMDPELQTLGTHVQLTKKLGQGGFGSVYAGVVARVQHDGAGHCLVRSSGKFVAVKVFQRVQPSVEGMRLQQQICRELEAMQFLFIEPNVVKLLAHGELNTHDSSPAAASHQASNAVRQRPLQCAVLELIPNSLQRTLNYVAVLGEEEVRVAARQLAKQLSVMHSGEVGKVIIHCDIKPDNVLVNMAGEFLLSDFGGCLLAPSPWDLEATATKAVLEVSMQTIVASPYYTAPELYHRVAAARDRQAMQSAVSAGSCMGYLSDFTQSMVTVDASIDVFSLGVLVARLLVGPLERLMPEAPQTLEQIDQWEQVLAEIVDRKMQLPDGLQLSAGALEFIGCACGVGQARQVAQQQGAAKRLLAAELLLLPWLRL